MKMSDSLTGDVAGRSALRQLQGLRSTLHQTVGSDRSV